MAGAGAPACGLTAFGIDKKTAVSTPLYSALFCVTQISQWAE